MSIFTKAMSKQPKFPEELYLSEIETWRQSSKLHADNAIKQYKKVTEGLEAIYFEKTRNEAILSTLGDGIIIYDEQHNIIIFNKMAEKIFDISAKKVLHKNFDSVFETLNPYLLTFARKQCIGSNKKRARQIMKINDLYISCRLDFITIRNQHYHLLLLEDSTDLFATQLELKKEKGSLQKRVDRRTHELKLEVAKKELAKRRAEMASLTDPLTKLPNRKALVEELKHTLELMHSGQQFAVLFIDLDGFKPINDTLGHYAGDVLLIEIAKRIKSCIRDNDFCARMGGDEFVILLNHIQKKDTLKYIAENLLNSIAVPIDFNDSQSMAVSASIGIYASDNRQLSISDILSNADEAMYSAKSQGKNCYVIFNAQLEEKMRHKKHIRQNLDDAFINNEFIIYFQPICDVDKNIVGAESLARWKHNGEFISPAKFIPLLEESGRIIEFTHYVIEQVYLQLIAEEQFPCVSINLSIQQFYDEDFIGYIEEIFKYTPEVKSRISFEITESMFHKDPHILQKGISQLRKLGFRVYIDDFGTGYSSFAYIRNFKTDVIKIDRAFVIDIENDQKNADLLNGMVSLLTSMGMDIVIEGVENKQQLDLIKSFNADVKIQGYYFYKPMPFNELISTITTK